MKVCSVEGCDKRHDSKGLCHMHYNRWKRHGDPLAPLQIAPDGSGWVQRGYRIFTTPTGRKGEHVLVAERALGKPLPVGAVVHHADENRLNNAGSNLVICPDNKYHRLLHVRIDAMNACGHPNWRKCTYCGEYDDTANMRGEKSGRFVHRQCSANARMFYYERRRSA